jgi:hypothetical protein
VKEGRGAVIFLLLDFWKKENWEHRGMCQILIPESK